MSILSSTKFVIDNSKFVKINRNRIFKLAKKWPLKSQKLPKWDKIHHFFDNSENTIQYLFLLDSLNFCFWSSGDKLQWKIKYGDEYLRGYYALSTSLKQAIKNGYPILDADYLVKISKKDLSNIFQGQGQIPLFKERLAIIHENAKILNKLFNGRATNLVKEAQKSGLKLVNILIKYFPSFRDWSYFKGRQIFFLKRAQILVADIYLSFRGKKWGEFNDLEKLTCFADYKLPQFLENLEILQYSPALLKKIKTNKEILANSREEIEIRASTIWSVEYLKQILKKHKVNLRSIDIDWSIWNQSQKIKFKHPHHNTLTIFY